jgi:predicted enzyme related to lactoylglutathione lyase
VSVRLSHVMIDALDPEALASFWAVLLGVEVAARVDGGRFVFLTASEGVPAFGLQRVPEPKESKNRVHVDLEVEDLDEATRWIRAHGGSKVAEHRLGDFHWRIVADPEGNEFCIVPRSAE